MSSGNVSSQTGTGGCGCPVHDYEEHYDDAGTFVVGNISG